MIDGTYNIYIDALLGQGRGKVTITTEGDTAIANISAPVIGRQRVRGKVQDDTFTAKGSRIVFPLGKLDFKIRCQVIGDDVQVDIKSNRGNFKFKGARA